MINVDMKCYLEREGDGKQSALKELYTDQRRAVTVCQRLSGAGRECDSLGGGLTIIYSVYLMTHYR